MSKVEGRGPMDTSSPFLKRSCNVFMFKAASRVNILSEANSLQN